MRYLQRHGASPRLAVLAAALVLLAVAPTGQVSAAQVMQKTDFSVGVSSAMSSIAAGGVRYPGPSIVVPNNASFLDGAFDVEAPYGGNLSAFDSGASGFSQGTIGSGFSRGAGGLTLNTTSATQFDSFVGGPARPLQGLVARGGGLELVAGTLSGTVTVLGGIGLRSPLLMFTPTGRTPEGTSFSFEVTDASNGTLRQGILPGELVDLSSVGGTPGGYRVRLTTAWSQVTPVLQHVHVGTALGDAFTNSTVVRSLPPNIRGDGSALRAPPNPLSLYQLSTNAVITNGSSNSWYAGDQFTSPVVRVGNEYWAYFNSGNSTGSFVGRAVSSDFVNWVVDPSPMLRNGTESYDTEGILGVTSVVFDPNKGRYNMYYGCGGYYSNPDSCLATSPDGITWTKWFANPIVNTVASTWYQFRAFQPVLSLVGNSYKLYVLGNADDYSSNIGLWTSSDGENFTVAAGNPTFPRRAGSGIDHDIGWGTVIFNGTHYIHFYTCTDGTYSWDTCVATSTDGVGNWTRHGVAIYHDNSGWDGWAIGWPGVIWDDNRFFFLYAGLPCDPVPAPCPPDRSLGAGASRYLTSTHNFTGRFDLGALRPAGWGPLMANFTGGGIVSFAVRSSHDTVSWSPFEPVANGSAPAVTPIRQYVEYRVQITAASSTSTPTVSAVRIGFTVAPPQATFESRVIGFGSNGTTFRVTPTTGGFATSETWEWRPNSSAPWTALVPGAITAALPGQNSLQYRVNVTTPPNSTFVISRVDIDWATGAPANDMRVELGPAESPTVIELPGPLVSRTRIQVAPELLNGLLAFARGRSAPGADLSIDIGVRAAEPTTVFFTNFSSNLSFPENSPPSVVVVPNVVPTEVTVGDTLMFEAAAVDAEGDVVSFSWYVNGSLRSSADVVSIAFDAPGTWAIELRISSVGFDGSVSWSVAVVPPVPPPPPPPPVVSISVLPPAGPLQADVGDVGQFVMDVNGSAGTSWDVAWFVNSTLASSSPSLAVLYSAPGDWTVSARVNVDGGSRTFDWPVRVAAPIPPPDTPPTIGAYPAPGRIELSLGASFTFHMVANDPDGGAVNFTWYLNGSAVSSDANFTRLFDAPGNWTVLATFEGGGVERDFFWTVGVTAPPEVSTPTEPAEATTPWLTILLGVGVGLVAGLLIAMATRRLVQP